MNHLKKLYSAYRNAMVIGAAICGGLIFYVVIVEVLRSIQGPAEPLPEDPLGGRSYLDLLRLVFYIIAFAQFAVLAVARGILLRAGAAEPVDSLIDKLTRATIVTLAICEVPAIMGLVLFFTGRFRADFYVLLGISMAMLFFYFPRYHRWKDWIQRKAGPGWETEGSSSIESS